MKILTLRQPWATLIMQGNKKFEIKNWDIGYRGDIVIRAAKGVDREALKKLRKYLPSEIPAGLFLGRVTIKNCEKCDGDVKNKCISEGEDLYFRSEFENSYAWELENIVVFDEPIKVKGDMKLFELKPEVDSVEAMAMPKPNRRRRRKTSSKEES